MFQTSNFGNKLSSQVPTEVRTSIFFSSLSIYFVRFKNSKQSNMFKAYHGIISRVSNNCYCYYFCASVITRYVFISLQTTQ